ncbi:ABC transporter permease [Candidatus Methylacidiphilum fumarolicum]|uniref:ABC-type transport system involved in gliding motility, permease component n=3 Tax=Candidatus Methylacidiphilum fumarolicum TaxID=591154 RepID=I0K018_METFB|nr:ABC transporter permease [Candidatus Methylacidiphilum fumarolicum]MBW6415138.1 ABC transporter permease [Candidatus Methylacidiphilum fumarolicum]TFE65982.1 ABC transporter permease [Candidatus Methylacidiphilum fumarolicum]TFE72711.1 ABC transporter permease [Candidatus Methylacidiphilum fumarolicum]TFE73177.1 ABC transporter permease [Candidatus Methylacidiphilum fumarolicum]TFE77582.1 ABC transporter permease [Candidatus Methylacidiphilum fumarolicum]
MALLTLFQREMKSYFVSPVAYILLFSCSLINGASFVFWLNYLSINNIKEFTLLQACMNAFFFWFLLLVQVPVLTMRSFAEEYKLGTIEMILTAPVREWELVLSKFLGSVCFFSVLWMPMALYLAVLRIVYGHSLGMSAGMIVLPFLMLLLIGMFFISIGLFVSSLTKNQIIAAILSFALIFLIFSLSFLIYLGIGGQTREMISYLSFLDQMDTFSRGIFDSRPVVLLGSATFFFLFLTEKILEWRRLRE